MRKACAPALVLGAVLLTAPAALAAPTCLDRAGGPIRCGTSGAMPVGWAPPPDLSRDRFVAQPGDVSATGLVGLAIFLAGLFGLIALMPDFEERWDGQANDDDA